MKRRTVIGFFAAVAAVAMAGAQPVIVAQPQDQTILEGANVSFSVEATGITPSRYQGLRYTNLATHGVIPGETNPVLHLPAMPYTFHGFAAVVSDQTGVVISRIGRLVFALRFLQQPESQTITQTLTAHFTAIGAGTVPFTLQWYFQNVPLSKEIAENLILPDAEPEEVGVYTAVLSSSLGSITSRIASLTVIAGTNAPASPPSFVNFETAPVHPVALSPELSSPARWKMSSWGKILLQPEPIRLFSSL